MQDATARDTRAISHFSSQTTQSATGSQANCEPEVRKSADLLPVTAASSALPLDLESPQRHAGVSVISAEMFAKAHAMPLKTLQRAFQRHRDDLIAGVDYFEVSDAVFSSLFESDTLSPASKRGGYTGLRALFTKSGYLGLSATLRGPKAAKIRRAMVHAFLQLEEEKANPELAVERGIQRSLATYLKRGLTEEQALKRVQTILTRKKAIGITDGRGFYLREHYQEFSNATYLGLVNMTAAQWRRKLGLKPNQNLRDFLDPVYLDAIHRAEALGAEIIRDENLQTFEDCRDAMELAGLLIRSGDLEAIRTHGWSLLDKRQTA